ncbi:PAAR domain-containing protein [Photorhabdus thracensis]|uniref:PAAR domain-containing protein n=1 Tax=Photorhabdus thracensis TaxID=230089 RepID=UPI001E2A9E46|nr:PAAR domain-containing protein [Photorhabdus thracensis]MCC8423125.1 PAAR domain-containing protein [Photorhabdus thracensis]
MNSIIRIGDKTTCGGQVISGSLAMKFNGIGVARKGDKVACPVTGQNSSVIIEGNPECCDDGDPIAFHGCRCACGGVLLSSLLDVTAS